MSQAYGRVYLCPVPDGNVGCGSSFSGRDRLRGDEPTDLADPLVDALVVQRSLEASAEVMTRADDALGTPLDALV